MMGEKSTVEPHDLESEPQICLPRNEYGSSAIDSVFDKLGITRDVRLETSHSTIACSLVAQGLGVSIVNPLAAIEYRYAGIVIRPFMPAIKHSAHLLYPRGKANSRLVTSFVETLKKQTSDDAKLLVS
jgi:DNA-binding transcriptional LysR family regulator